MKNDGWTIGAAAVVAMVAATTAHEALGHAGACLVLRGQVTLLTSVYFHCHPSGPWIDIAGPIGNLLAAALALMALPLLKSAAGRLFAILLFAMSASWFAGYLIYSFLLLKGDYLLALEGFLPQLTISVPMRLAAIAAGLGVYALSVKILKYRVNFASAQSTLMISWCTATAAAMIAAAFYAPDRLGAVKDGAFEIGLASVPLLMFGKRAEDGVAVARSPLWIGTSVLLYAVFVWLLGRGIG